MLEVSIDAQRVVSILEHAQAQRYIFFPELGNSFFVFRRIVLNNDRIVSFPTDFSPFQVKNEAYASLFGRFFWRLVLLSPTLHHGKSYRKGHGYLTLLRRRTSLKIVDMKYSFSLILLCLSLCVTRAQNPIAAPTGTGTTGEADFCRWQDAEGYWWYGGKGTGLCRYDGYETEVFRSDRQHPNLLRSNDVLCLTEVPSRAEIWFGTKEGAFRLSKSDYTIRPIEVANGMETNELADKRITCLATAPDSSVWLTYRNQLLHFSADGVLQERLETTWQGKNRSVLRLALGADGTLWVGLWNGGTLSFRWENGVWHPEEHSSDDFPVVTSSSLSPDQQKQQIDSLMTLFAPGNDAKVLSWVTLPDGHIYIGTYHALYLYDGQKVEQKMDGLDKVRSMAYTEAQQTLYLLSKARGVCRWKEDQLTVLLDSVQYRQMQLQGDTALLLSEGISGIRLLDLRTLQLSADTTLANVRPVVTAYVVGGKRQLLPYGQRQLTFPRETDLVEFSLSTLTFEQPSRVQFAYRWKETAPWTELPEGKHVIQVAHLAADTTHLQVRATDMYGRWGASTEVLTLYRPARWQESVWVWLCLAFIVLPLALGWFVWRRKRALKVDRMAEGKLQEETDPLSVADREFMNKAVAAVSAHMTDSDYSVDALASDLCMSRANLYRRMRGITGQSPTDFLRNQRLEHAAHLLCTTSHSVNEIADLVGFAYASYFSKCFKDKYGVLPKDYKDAPR